MNATSVALDRSGVVATLRIAGDVTSASEPDLMAGYELLSNYALVCSSRTCVLANPIRARSLCCMNSLAWVTVPEVRDEAA